MTCYDMMLRYDFKHAGHNNVSPLFTPPFGMKFHMALHGVSRMGPLIATSDGNLREVRPS